MSAPIRCTGRPVDTAGQPVGDECGRTFTGPRTVFDGLDADWRGIYRPPTVAEVAQHARAAGWRLGILADGTAVATCPACSRPDPTTVAICRDLERGLRP